MPVLMCVVVVVCAHGCVCVSSCRGTCVHTRMRDYTHTCVYMDVCVCTQVSMGEEVVTPTEQQRTAFTLRFVVGQTSGKTIQGQITQL